MPHGNSLHQLPDPDEDWIEFWPAVWFFGKLLLILVVIIWWIISPSRAQSTFTVPPPAGTVVLGVQVVSTCGAATITPPAVAYLAMNASGQLCTNASGGGGGGAVTIANGADTAEGSTTDTPCTFPTTTTACTMIALAKAIVNATNSPIPAGTNAIGSITNTSFNGASNVTPNDCSGTVVTGGTAVNAFTAQTTLHGFTIANYDTAHNDEVLWVSFTTTAAASTAGSYPLPAPTATTFAGFGSFTTPAGFGLNHALSVVAATSGHAFSCTWW